MNRYRKWRTRVGAARSVYSLYNHPPSTQAIQFLIKKPIMRVPVTPAQPAGRRDFVWHSGVEVPARAPTPGASPGSILVYPVTRVPAGLEQTQPRLEWQESRLRKFHQRHAGSSGGDRDDGLGGP